MAKPETCRPCADGDHHRCTRIIRRNGRPTICACWREHRPEGDE